MRIHLANRFKVGVATLALVATGFTTMGAASSSAATAHVTGKVLLVGTFNGKHGQYTSIQAAVNAASPGDWILVAPGDYRESADIANPPAANQLRSASYGSVLITKNNIHIRGMNRNTTIIDGTSSGAACNGVQANQNLGPVVRGQNIGRNGNVVYMAKNVTIDNLTTCNFLSGSGDTGNGIYWNGGAGTSLIGLNGYEGSYLTATNQYNGGTSTAGSYGIFSSDATNGSWDYIYASNQDDSGMYVGACQQQCNMLINHAWMENNALGYSGTNSGGQFIIENSLFDNNKDGFDTNTQLVGDPPPPQNGACPNNGISKLTKTHSCWVVYKNIFKNNNNANVPQSGGAAAGPLGTGLSLSGGRNDTIMDNTFIGNNAWGLALFPFPDTSLRNSNAAQCVSSGGTSWASAGLGCIYEPENNSVIGNTFSGNGAYGNQTNGDIALISLDLGKQINCLSGNKTPGGIWPTSFAGTAFAKCNGTKTGYKAPYLPTTIDDPIVSQALCDTGFGGCASGMHYPKSNTVILAPLPAASKLVTMPNPCVGAPSSAWCVKGKPIK